MTHRSWTARRRPARSALSSWACASRARPSARSPPPSRSCARRWCRRGARGCHRHRRHRRRRRRDAQHLDDHRHRRRRRRRPRRQARQPRAVLANPAPPTCSQALGVKLDLTPEQIGRCIREAGIGFMFAPAHHPAMKHVGPTRVEMGTRTMFNLLGPQSNPAGVRRYMLGVYARQWVEPVAAALLANRAITAWVVHGDDGLDEISTTGPTFVASIKGGNLTQLRDHPRGCRPAARHARTTSRAPTRPTMPRRLRALLDGAPGAYRDIVLLNAAAAFIVAGRADTLKLGVDLAAARDRQRPRQSTPSTASLRFRTDVIMSDILQQIEAYKREEIAAAKSLRPWNEVVAEAHDAPPVRALPLRAQEEARHGRLCPHRRGQEGQPVQGSDPRRLQPVGNRPRLRAGRRHLPLRPHRPPQLPGRAELPDRGPRRDAAAGAAQGFHVRDLPGRRSPRLGRRLHPHHPRRRRRRHRPLPARRR